MWVVLRWFCCWMNNLNCYLPHPSIGKKVLNDLLISTAASVVWNMYLYFGVREVKVRWLIWSSVMVLGFLAFWWPRQDDSVAKTGFSWISHVSVLPLAVSFPWNRQTPLNSAMSALNGRQAHWFFSILWGSKKWVTAPRIWVQEQRNISLEARNSNIPFNSESSEVITKLLRPQNIQRTGKEALKVNSNLAQPLLLWSRTSSFHHREFGFG